MEKYNLIESLVGFYCSICWDPMENRCWSHCHTKLLDFFRKNTLDHHLLLGISLGVWRFTTVAEEIWKNTGLLFLLISSRWFWLGLCDTMGYHEIPSSRGRWATGLENFKHFFHLCLEISGKNVGIIFERPSKHMKTMLSITIQSICP